MHGARGLLLLFLIDVAVTSDVADVDWWGDPRANGAAEFAFYDVSYDDTLCEGSDAELRSNAIHDYIYLGRLISATPVFELNDCLRKCLLIADQCKAVNYYRAAKASSEAYCELLADTQYDNPAWMKKFIGGQYYESIHCQHGPDDRQETSPSTVIAASDQAWKKSRALDLKRRIDAFLLRSKRT